MKPFMSWRAIFAALALVYLFWGLFAKAPGGSEIPYSKFLSDIEAGKISQVSLSKDFINGEFKSGEKKKVRAGKAKSFSVARVDDPTLVQTLRAKHVQFTGLPATQGFWGGVLISLLPWMIIIGVWSFIFKKSPGMARGGGFLSLGQSKAKVYVETDLKTRFEDVAGVDEVKEDLQEVVNFLREPERYSTLGGRMPKGILLVGPPGTGKTLLARAVAGEAKVPFFSINGPEFVEMFVGLGAARVRDLFVQARSKAPCIIFIDELDALGKARGISAISGGANDEKEQTLNQLLAEMDGFDASQGVILLAATNRPQILDPALLRAGRFDRSILVDKPDRRGRVQILAVHLKKIKVASSVDVDAIASLTAGFSGADLANLVNEAALIATRRKSAAVERDDFTQAIERIVAGLERKSRILGPDEKKRVAYHEMGHTVVALALGHGEVIRKVSIIPRGMGALGYTLSSPTEDRYLMERNELETKITIALGGRSSESRFFSDISTGAGDDLDKASEIARAMVTRYGMSPLLGVGVFEKESSPLLGGYPPVRSFEYSEETARRIDSEVKKILDEAVARADKVIEKYRLLIEEATALLLVHETLDENALKEIWMKHKPAPVVRVV
jgi:cell division protease FtsH